MRREKLALSDIAAEDSRYYLPALQRLEADPDLSDSMRRVGQIDPLTVHETANREFHLIDGFARYASLQVSGKPEAEATVLPVETAPDDLMRYFFLVHRQRILESVTNRLRFLRLAKQSGVSVEQLRDRFLPLVEFDAHPRVWRRCEAVADLPEVVLAFCHDKRFSLKQCVHLTRHPGELLVWIFQWREHLALTASIIEELAGHIRDHLRATETAMEDFQRLPQITGVFEARLSPQERTKALRDRVRELRFPILTSTLLEMESIRRHMKLPREIELRWDPTLEQHEVELRIHLRDDGRWPQVVEALARPGVHESLGELLERL